MQGACCLEILFTLGVLSYTGLVPYRNTIFILQGFLSTLGILVIIGILFTLGFTPYHVRGYSRSF